jgi:antitoxin component YwqK of YwqJK toxin-antitoxin module
MDYPMRRMMRGNGMWCEDSDRNMRNLKLHFIFMRAVTIIMVGLISFCDAYSQVNTNKNIYSRLDTIETYDVGLSAEIGPGYAKYFVNDKEVDKRTYDLYKVPWDNIGKCTPCFLKTYDEDNILVRESVQYTDCAVGLWIEYYPNGRIKVIGHYKENDTGNWKDIYKRGYCSVRNGKWIYYDINGKETKIENYKEDKLGD